MDVYKALKKLMESCDMCKLAKHPPQIFLFLSGYKGTDEFNSAVFADIMKLIENYIIHVVCSRAGSKSDLFLRDQTASTLGGYSASAETKYMLGHQIHYCMMQRATSPVKY